jgi:thiol-disulfide isomerase/thioredoxin
MSYRSVFLAFFSVFLAFSLALGVSAQSAFHPGDAPKPGEPTDPKARKTYASGIAWEEHRAYESAIGDYRKANKQDGGKCFECLSRAFRLAFGMGAFKDAAEIAREMLPMAQDDRERAGVHIMLGRCLLEQSTRAKKRSEDGFSASTQEFNKALELDPRQVSVHYYLGIALANLQQDEAARAAFHAFIEQDRRNPDLHPRAQRFVERVELARARMAPAFTVTTLDGQRISMDDLAGKVVLIDFWATWCGPCREALPHIRQIAKKFDGQPLVVLSVSLDDDAAKWKEFVAKNGMNWLQYRDGGFTGVLSTEFAVTAIPATFTIDADGVLEDQHVGDADIESKLKKLVAHAAALKPPPPAIPAAGTGN